MSLPPDPHDDDLAEPPAPAPPPPPASTADPHTGPAPEPPSSPAYITAPPLATASAPPPASTEPAGADATGVPAPGGAAPAHPSATGDGRSRLGLILAGVVAVIVIAGGVVVATSDDADMSSVDGRSAVDDEAGGKGDDATAGARDDGSTEVGDGEPGTSPSDESPVEAAEAFFAAVASRDCDGIVARMTPESYGVEAQRADQAVADCRNDTEGTAAAAAARYEDIELVVEEGDRASVSVTITVDGRETERDLPLRRVDGRWLMDLDTSLVAPAT